MRAQVAAMLSGTAVLLRSVDGVGAAVWTTECPGHQESRGRTTRQERSALQLLREPLQVVEHQPGPQRTDRQEPAVVAHLERPALLDRGQPLPQPAGGDLPGGGPALVAVGGVEDEDRKSVV